MQHLDIIRKYYPDAAPGKKHIDKLFDLLKTELDLSPHQIMHADSLCCDDINTIEYPQRAYEMLGPFKMGGLNGYPFAGLTGMKAFAHHVPKDGAVLLFYAPHIGITQNGEIGRIHRTGQEKTSGCCGAAAAALQNLLDHGIQADAITDIDYQQNTIEQIFLKEADRIRKAEIPIMEATEVMYEAIAARIDTLISMTDFPCRKILSIGGIMINGDPEMGSFAAFRRFDVIDTRSKKTESLLHHWR